MISSKRLQMLDIAIKELGVNEVKGKGSNPRILEYHSVTTLNATNDGVAWCSSFVNWVVTRAGHEPTRSAMAASWKRWGRRLSKPKKGCIIGYVNADGSGHVGFYVGAGNGIYKILGGNQRDSVNITNYKINRKQWFYVEPKVFINSKTAGAGGAIATVGAASSNEILDMLTEFKADTETIKENVGSVADNVGLKNSVTEYMPFVIMALAIFVIYDRLNKERVKDGD